MGPLRGPQVHREVHRSDGVKGGKMGVAPIAERGMLTAFSLRTFLNEPVERESFIAEGTIKGLFLLRRRATRNARHPNRASWVLRWSDDGKRRKKLIIGDARSISLDAARKAAQANLAKVIQGTDPAQDRRDRRSRRTVAEVWAAYSADLQFTSKSSGTRYNDANRYRLHVSDRIGSKLIDELDLQTVEKLIAAIRNAGSGGEVASWAVMARRRRSFGSLLR